jgi:hypothetical protein
MTKLSPLALVALVGASSGVAAAQTYVATDSYQYARPPAPTYKEVDARLGLLLGGTDVGDADGFAPGASAAIGYRIGDITLRGMFDYYRVGDGSGETMSRNGRGSRVGGAIRYAFAHSPFDSKTAADLWGELGAGYEHVAWRHGGVVDRPSGELAVGMDLGFRGDRDASSGRRKTIGYFMAFRTLVGEGPELAGVTATCSGPCTKATMPSRTDLSMFFELGVRWGH